MIHICYRPGPPLNEFVDYFWLIEGGQAQRLEKILPSGTIELVINLKQDEIHIHDPERPERHERMSGAVFSGTYSRPFVCNAQQHEAILGVHFRQAVHFHSLVWRRANSPTRTLTCLTYGEDPEMSCVSAYAPSQHLRSAFESWKLSYKLVFTISRALNFKRRLRSR